MSKYRWLIFLLVALLAIATLVGLYRLFELRFQAGDVYPPYSSLRADPLGSKVLFDALHETSGFDVSRNYSPLEKINDPANAVIFYSGVPTDSWDAQEVDDLAAIARQGGRLIITFLPVDAAAAADAAKWRRKSPKPDKKNDKSNDDEEEPKTIDVAQFARDWGFHLGYRAVETGTSALAPLVASAMDPGTEPTLSWHTALFFPRPTAAWHVLYRCDGAPVIMERPFGHGSIVLASDSYFLSNEAMRNERAPLLLTSILGARSRVVFDETHLGVRENPGIATLVRKYNLGALMFAIGVLACLFIWQSSSPFLPPGPDSADTEIVLGKDSTSGFVSLLRRGIPPSRLIETCLDQWKKSFPHGSPKLAGMIARIESTAAQGGREPVATYRAICQIVAEKK
jgi:hypothetical protein